MLMMMTFCICFFFSGSVTLIQNIFIILKTVFDDFFGISFMRTLVIIHPIVEFIKIIECTDVI